MSDELRFKLRETPTTEDERRRMVDAFAAAFPPRSAFGAELCAAIEQAAAGEAFRRAYLRDFAPAVAALRSACVLSVAFPKFTIPALPPAALESVRGVAAHEAAARHAFALAADLRPSACELMSSYAPRARSPGKAVRVTALTPKPWATFLKGSGGLNARALAVTASGCAASTRLRH